MKMLAALVMSTVGFMWYVNSPWTLVQKSELADLRARVAAYSQANAHPVAAAPAPERNGAWMWQNDRANPLDAPAYNADTAVSGGPTVYGGATYYYNHTTIVQPAVRVVPVVVQKPFYYNQAPPRKAPTPG